MTKEKFEVSLKKLEKIVDELEAGELSLEETLKKYEEGVKLSRVCSKTLSEAEKKIEVLSKNLDGEFETTPYDAADETEDHPRKRKKNK